MFPMTLEDRARMLATMAHYGIKNPRNGEDYILHPTRVASYVRRAIRLLEQHSWKEICNDSDTHPLGRYGRWGEVQELIRAICWLHDTLEDTWVTEKILRQHFADHPEVTPAVINLSRNRNPGVDYYRLLAEHALTLVAKLADIMDNGDPHRLAKIEDEADRVRLEEKYEHAAQRMGVEEEYKSWIQSRCEQMTLGGPLKQAST